MSQPLPKTHFLPETNEAVNQFVSLLQYLFESAGQKNPVPWTAVNPWPLQSPEEIVSDLKNQGCGVDLEPAIEFHIVHDQGLGEKLPIVCLLRTLHPLTFIFRLYCQKHGSLIENWMDGLVTMREFSELQLFVDDMRKSKERFGQSKTQSDLIQALDQLVNHGFSGTVWCDWELNEAERALFVQMTKGKSMVMVEQPLSKPHLRNAAIAMAADLETVQDHAERQETRSENTAQMALL